MAARTLLRLLPCGAVLASGLSVWPPPKSIKAAGDKRPLHPSFQFVSTTADTDKTLAYSVLREGLVRYAALLPAARPGLPGASDALWRVLVQVGQPAHQRLTAQTDYAYRLEVCGGTGHIQAASVYGALYGMETFVQLVDGDGYFGSSCLSIDDAPQYNWRGLLIDTGRRFFPVPLVKNLLDTMAAVKLNVLHFHVLDHCRFAVESKLYPELTGDLTGDRAGHYTQADVKDIIQYAKARGIRVVPEFDIPAHDKGLIPLEKYGLTFCVDDASRFQIYNDPANKTSSILKALFAEMAALFEDDVFHLGCDETFVMGRCTADNLFALERDLRETVEVRLGRTPEGWEEILFTAKAADANTIVNGWSAHGAAEIVKQNFKAIESAASHFYFTTPAPGGPTGWKVCHYDISTGVPADKRALVQGGEMSMWSDMYLMPFQCGAFKGSPPPGAALFPPTADEAFSRSIGGMIWPRGFVAAASFWHFDASLDPTSAAFVQQIYELNDKLAARGSYVCPSRCSCDYLTACGKPYQVQEAII